MVRTAVALLHMVPLRCAFVVGVGTVLAACGARSQLETSASPDGGSTAGGAPEGGGVVAPPPVVPCAGVAAPGAVVWQTHLPAGETFTGAWAADSDGTTYFLEYATLATLPAASYSILALDSCGRQVWFNDGVATAVLGSTQIAPSVFVSGDQVIVQWGAVDSFDRANGAHRWNVNLNAFAGENLEEDSRAEIGPSAAAVDGTSFVAFETSDNAMLVSISPDGAPSLVAAMPATGDLISLIIDGAGELDVLFNSALQGPLVRSFAMNGSPVFSTPFACNDNNDNVAALASGSSFIAMQSGPCILPLEGSPDFFPSAGFANSAS